MQELVALTSALILGFLGGLVRACQGAYKDSPWEPFLWVKFCRSLFLGIVGGLCWWFVLRERQLGIHPAQFMALAVFFDTIATELYKRGFRVEDLSKYKMPSVLHVYGRVVKDRFLKGFLAFFVGCLVVLLFFAIEYVDRVWFANLSRGLLWGVGWGLVAGILAAVAGASMDAAWEGFEPLKFLRSVWVGGYWGAVFSFFGVSVPLLIFACFGMDRMSIEFYKTFIRKMKSGKFKSDEPTIPDWVEKREFLIVPYLISWLVFVFFLVAY